MRGIGTLEWQKAESNRSLGYNVGTNSALAKSV